MAIRIKAMYTIRRIKRRRATSLPRGTSIMSSPVQWQPGCHYTLNPMLLKIKVLGYVVPAFVEARCPIVGRTVRERIRSGGSTARLRRKQGRKKGGVLRV